MAKIEIQLAVELSDSDIGDMCDAAETAILDGGNSSCSYGMTLDSILGD